MSRVRISSSAPISPQNGRPDLDLIGRTRGMCADRLVGVLMRTRLLAALAATAALLGTALVALPTAHAAPPPGWPTGFNDWKKCNGSTVTKYCVVSAQRNGVEIPAATYDDSAPPAGTYKPKVIGFGEG